MVAVLIIIIVILVVVLMKNKADQNSKVDKNFTNITSRGSVIHVDNADIICTSAPKNGRGKKAYPPYDRLDRKSVV